MIGTIIILMYTTNEATRRSEVEASNTKIDSNNRIARKNIHDGLIAPSLAK